MAAPSYTRLAAPAASPAMVSTTFEVPGFDIQRSLGMVRGISVRGRGLGPMLCVVCQAIWWGGRLQILEHLCETARAAACEAMLSQARGMGANAVVGVRFDASALGPVNEVLAYGTAVLVLPRGGALAGAGEAKEGESM